MVKVICIDSKNMPPDYPDRNKWLKEMEIYRATEVKFLTKVGDLAIRVNEIDLNNTPPYFGFFKIKRFAIPKENLEDFKELIRASSDYDEDKIDLEELLEESAVD